MDSKTLRAELRDDQNHINWMELVAAKEAEMNGELPRKRRLSGEAQSTLTHIDETVIEGSMFLGVFWPKNIYEDQTKKRLQNPTTYTHNGQQIVGVVRPSSEGCPIGCIELRQIGRYGHGLQTILERDDEGGDAQMHSTLDSLRKLSKVTVSPIINNGQEEGYALKVGSGTKRRREDECSFLDALWDAPISGTGGQASSSKGSKEKSSSDKATPQKDSGKPGTPKVQTPTKGLTHIQKEYQGAERIIFEGSQILQQVGAAGDAWLTVSDKKIERVLSSLDKRLVPKCLELYSAQFQSDSKGMILLSELQKLKTQLKLLMPLVKALADKSAGDVVMNHFRGAIGGGVALSENMVKLAMGRFAAVHLEAREFDKWASCLLDIERPDDLMMLFPSERRAEVQAELVGAGLLQLLILENATQSVSEALKQLLLRKVLHPDMDTEINQLDLLSRCHEVGVAQSEEAMDFFVNHPHRRLHMGVKLFPTGLLLKSVVAAAKAQSIADQRLEIEIMKFGTRFATLCAPSALAQDGAGVWILQQDDRLQLKAAHQELAAFRTMCSTTLLQKHVELIAKTQVCIEAAAKMLSEKNVNRFVDKASVPLQKLSTVLDNTAGMQNTAVAESESLASGFTDAEVACKVPIDQIGLSDIASAEVCSNLHQEFADASRAVAKLRLSVHCIIQPEDLCDNLLLAAVDVAHEPPALLSKVPGFSPFKASFQKSIRRSILSHFSSKQQTGARSESNRVAALVVLEDIVALHNQFSVKVSATTPTMTEKDLKSEAAFQLVLDTTLARFCDGELEIPVSVSEGRTVHVPVGVATRMPQILATAQRLGELSQNVDEEFRLDSLRQISECFIKVSETLQQVKEWRGEVEFAQPAITTQLLRLTEHAVKTVLNGFDALLRDLGRQGEELIQQGPLLRMQTLLDGNFNGDEHGSVLLEMIGEGDVQQMFTLYKTYREALHIDLVQLRDTVEKVCGKTFDETWAQLDDAAAIFAKGPLTCVATLTAVQALFKEHAAKPDGTDRKPDIITNTLAAMRVAKPPLQPHPKLSFLLHAGSNAKPK